MTVVYIISFLLIAFGIVRILGLTPESIGADVSAILDRKKSLRDNAMRARGKKRTNKLVLWLDKIRRALSDTGKEKSFGVACAVALLLMILGCVGAIVIGNPFLAPVLAIALAMIPFLYLLRTVEQYEEQVKLELETGLSAITSSYERTINLKNAVEENIDNLKPPVKGLFQSFLVEISVINPDVKAAICHLRERVKDCVWEEWCDTLISCQDDSQLIGTLYPVVEKLTDMRIVNAELKVMISENKREYYIMALIYDLTAQMAELRRQMKLCEDIAERCGVVEMVVNEIERGQEREGSKNNQEKKAYPNQQTFGKVLELLAAGEVNEEDSNQQSILDEMFGDLAEEYPGHIALKYYTAYRGGAAKTLKSIQITLQARLEKFNLESLNLLCSADELDLKTLGTKKVALFALIPDNDTSFNFLVSMLYTQLFQQLFKVADSGGGALPVPVHFMMDEFANVSLPDDFDKILSVMRSRGVSVSIILQNLAQLKALFEKQWESIIGNCDEFVYLGGNEQSTHKYVSELLGKATIDTNTYGKSDGMRGNFSTNYQNTGRELMTPDEVRLLDNRYAILFIRGERPVLDFKYDLLKHPNLALTADGDRANAYEHGVRKPEGVRIEVVDISAYPGKTVKDFPEIDEYIANMEAFDDADLEVYLEFLQNERNKENEKQKENAS